MSIPILITLIIATASGLAQAGTEGVLYVLQTSSVGFGPPPHNSVEVIDLTNLTAITDIPIADGRPHSLAVSPDGKRVYVTLQYGFRGSSYTFDGVQVYDTESGLGVAEIELQGAGDSVISADGSTLYVTVAAGLVAIDTLSSTVSHTLGISGGPRSVSISPDGRTLGVVNAEATLSLIDTSTLEVAGVVTITNPGEPTNCDTAPTDVLITDTGWVLLWDANCDNLYQVELATTTQHTSRTIRLGRDSGSSFNYNNMLAYSNSAGRAFTLKESKELAVMYPLSLQFSFYSGFNETPSVPALNANGKSLYISVLGSVLSTSISSIDRFDVHTGEFTRDLLNLQNDTWYTRDMKILGPPIITASTGVCLSGVLPVVLFGQDDLDVGDIVLDSIAFGGASPLNCRVTDADDDGDDDLVCDFLGQDVLGEEANADSFLTARTYSGKEITGANNYNILPRACVKQGKKTK